MFLNKGGDRGISGDEQLHNRSHENGYQLLFSQTKYQHLNKKESKSKSQLQEK